MHVAAHHTCSTVALAHDHVRSWRHLTFLLLGSSRRSAPTAAVQDNRDILVFDIHPNLILSDVHTSRAGNLPLPSISTCSSVGKGTPTSIGVVSALTLIVGSRRLHGSPFTLEKSSTSQALSSGSSLIARAASAQSFRTLASAKESMRKCLHANVSPRRSDSCLCLSPSTRLSATIVQPLVESSCLFGLVFVRAVPVQCELIVAAAW